MRLRFWLGKKIAGGGMQHQDTSGFAADFGVFLKRQEGERFSGFNPRWCTQIATPSSKSPIAVCLHVYFTDLLPVICKQLAKIPFDFDLFVTNASGIPVREDALEGAGAKYVRIFDVENRGRDIWPMVQLVNAGIFDGYDLVLKIHTKKSPWRQAHTLIGDGDEWRQSFYLDLLNSSENIATIVQSFLDNPAIGAITANGSVLGKEHLGGNELIVRHLLQRISLEPDFNDLNFAAGSIYWIRGFILQGLRAFMLDAECFENEKGQVDATTAHALERVIGIVTRESGMLTLERAALDDLNNCTQVQPLREIEEINRKLRRKTPKVRCLAFYLPQFHTFKENDMWWGKGFSEWHNVVKARQVYIGHNVPILPSDLGFYDLNMDTVRDAQAELARYAGVEAFMYYYYWFGGKKVMDMPINKHLHSDNPQSFCIMWANENWTRRWDGADTDILLKQDYSGNLNFFIDDIAPILRDKRYFRISDACVLAVYRPGLIPDFKSVFTSWRKRARELEIGELYILAVDVGGELGGLQPGIDTLSSLGVDGFLAFPPHNHPTVVQKTGIWGKDLRFDGEIYSYADMPRAAFARFNSSLPDGYIPGAMVGFDNTPRRQWSGHIWHGSNPYTFRRWVRECVQHTAHRGFDERVIAINAWNEWAEGAVLEPSVRWGKTYLQAVRSAVV